MKPDKISQSIQGTNQMNLETISEHLLRSVGSKGSAKDKKNETNIFKFNFQDQKTQKNL